MRLSSCTVIEHNSNINEDKTRKNKTTEPSSTYPKQTPDFLLLTEKMSGNGDGSSDNGPIEGHEIVHGVSGDVGSLRARPIPTSILF